MPMTKEVLKMEINAAVVQEKITYKKVIIVNQETGETKDIEVTEQMSPLKEPLLTALAEVVSHIKTWADLSILPIHTGVISSPSVIDAGSVVTAGSIPGPGTTLPTPYLSTMSTPTMTATSKGVPEAGPIQ